MSVQLTLIAHAPTAATRASAFPTDDPLDPTAQAAAFALAHRLRRVDAAWTSPAIAARDTAAALGLHATPDDSLRDLDCAAWAGRPLDDIARTDPAGLAAWCTDPAATPHGGESVEALVRRISTWLQTLPPAPDRVVAVSHAAILRAALVAALDASPAAFWSVDAAPLARLRLNRGPSGRWVLRSLGPLGP